MSTDDKSATGCGSVFGDGLGAASEALCACKDRAASACPGEWEPGCDLGNNPAHCVPAPAWMLGQLRLEKPMSAVRLTLKADA